VLWLHAKGRVDEAEKIIRNAAKLNNVTMPDRILVRPEGTTETVDRYSSSNANGIDTEDNARNLKYLKKSEKTKDTSPRHTMCDIFRNRRLTINALCMAFLWFVISHLCLKSS